MEEKSVFETLNAVNCNGHVEKKKDMSYLSWAWAWQIAKSHYPDATYTIYENADGWFYHTDGRTAWVKTGVTINGVEMIEYLPVMDFRNNSIPAENVTSFDVNKSIQRSLTKALARHGLGLYIYAGEDLPSDTASEWIEAIKRAKTVEELSAIYYDFAKQNGTPAQGNWFIQKLSERKTQIMSKKETKTTKTK